MTFEDFCKEHHATLIGYYLLESWFPEGFDLEVPYPPAVLNDAELAELKGRLRECMPLDSIVTDLWDWDIHFEEKLSDDWFFSAAFGSTAALDACSSELKDFFIQQTHNFALDYNQHEDEEWFADFVKNESMKFIEKWQFNISQYMKEGKKPQRL